ncbi:MAG: hypothetical protein AMJ43_08410 [Coxiella sp. DG_40]|nr:MAG: hypothetical protein AMJ43_08410 [Coxiella sp. DG_40]
MYLLVVCYPSSHSLLYNPIYFQDFSHFEKVTKKEPTFSNLESLYGIERHLTFLLDSDISAMKSRFSETKFKKGKES